MSTGSGGAYSWQEPQTAATPVHATWSAPQRPHTSHQQESSLLRHTAPPQVSQGTQAAIATTTTPGHASMTRGMAQPPIEGAAGAGVQNGQADGIPEPPQQFPELESMSMNDLRTLHDERAKFEDYISKHSHQRKIEDLLANLRTNVETLEETHRKTQEERQAASSASRTTAPSSSSPEQTNESDVESVEQQVKDLEAQVASLQKEQDDWYASHSPERLMGRLREGISEMESQSEVLEKNMLSSSMNFEDFLTRYMECRKKYHERYLKLERLKVETKQDIKYGR